VILFERNSEKKYGGLAKDFTTFRMLGIRLHFLKETLITKNPKIIIKLIN